MKTFSTQAISGIVLFIGGLLCVMFPVMGALDVEAMLGVILLLSGIFHIVGAVEDKREPDYIWGVLNSFVYLSFGLFLLADPYQGLQLMPLIVFLFLISHAIFTVGAAYAQKPTAASWIWTLFSAILSLILATLIFFGQSTGNPWTLGMITGVSILGYGISLLVTSGVVETDGTTDLLAEKDGPSKKARSTQKVKKSDSAKKTSSARKK